MVIRKWQAALTAGLLILTVAGCTQTPARRGGDTPTPGPGDQVQGERPPDVAADPAARISAALNGTDVVIVGNTAFVAMAPGTNAATATPTPTNRGTNGVSAGGTPTAPDVTGTVPGSPATPNVNAPGAQSEEERVAGAIRGAAPYLTEMRLAGDADIATRLAGIATSIRGGRSAAEFLDELADLAPQMRVLPLTAMAPNATPPAGTTAPGATPGPGTTTAPGTVPTPGTAPAPTRP